MANKKALHLIELGLHPVLLGSDGDDLKRPLLKGWQTAVYPSAAICTWPPHNNVGIRCGTQPNGRHLLVFDFDADATRIFPIWLRQARRHLPQPLIVVSSGRGYHAYFYTDAPHPGRTLAGTYVPAPEQGSGRKRLVKFIETLGVGRQVVSAGSRHPSGRAYRFHLGSGYQAIPALMPGQLQQVMAISQAFDQRPKQPAGDPAARSRHTVKIQGDIANCLDYARRYIGSAEQVERNGDIRFLGQGGLLITADGRGWYSFSDDTGGGLPELIAWHQSITGDEQC